jgi:hypothetical protein
VPAAIAHLAVMRWGKAIAIGAVFCGLGAAAWFVRYAYSSTPVWVKVEDVLDLGDGGWRLTLWVGNRCSRNIYFATNQQVQTLVAKTWREPERFFEMANSFLEPHMERTGLTNIVPPRAEACRFLLAYNTDAPHLRATEWFCKHRLYGRFPKTCGWIVKRLPHKAGWTHIAPVIKLPAGVESRDQVLGEAHNFCCSECADRVSVAIRSPRRRIAEHIRSRRKCLLHYSEW